MKKEVMERIFEELESYGDKNSKKVRLEISEITSDADVLGSPIVKILNALILQGVQKAASDIHIETYEDYIRLRYRIDGVLQEIRKIPSENAAALLSRLKIMAKLDIAERRIPQDGRFKIRIKNRDIDFRVSIIPTMYGEKAVLRILDTKNFSTSLESLGFSEEGYEKLLKCISRSHGMILVVGPTGSGKTTTLYSVIDRLNREEVNILTAEDPIEYEILGVNQVSCRNDIGLGFSGILRSFLRQDPDVIMVGEIRDAETGEIALKASLTGHLVISTLHTQNVFTAISRLINLGLEPHMIANSLSLVQSQRLARKLCPECKTEDCGSEKKLKDLGIEYLRYREIKFYKPAGCTECNGGYRGRVVFQEVLMIDEEMKEQIEKGASSRTLEETASEKGIEKLLENGIKKAAEGLTSLDEIIRVC